MEPVDWMPRLESEVRRVGAFQLEGARTLRRDEILVKPDSREGESVVTRYDIESETMLRDFVRREFPGHSFLGEETGNEVRDPAHYWIVDPIDGTTNFTLGIPLWGTSLAYWREGRPSLGLIYFPVLDGMYTASRGGGAQLNGAPIHTSADREYTLRNGVALHSRTHLSHTLHLRTKVRVLGSVIANLCYVAQGMLVAAYAKGRLWDYAAGALLVEEAGGIVDTQPDLLGFDLATYALAGGPAPSITLFAHANPELPSLSRFLLRIPATT
jgi:myo-inositol-1(or 4)-monophosphatase